MIMILSNEMGENAPGAHGSSSGPPCIGCIAAVHPPTFGIPHTSSPPSLARSSAVDAENQLNREKRSREIKQNNYLFLKA
jgi:hypothetical protein